MSSPNSDSEAGPPNDRQSSLLRTIPENEDTDDETSANDTDAATALEHMRNLPTHFEDQEFRRQMVHSPGSALSTDCDSDQDTVSDGEFEYLDHDDGGVGAGAGSGMRGSFNLKIALESANSSSVVRKVSRDTPGNTPPPASPRYKSCTGAS